MVPGTVHVPKILSSVCVQFFSYLNECFYVEHSKKCSLIASGASKAWTMSFWMATRVHAIAKGIEIWLSAGGVSDCIQRHGLSISEVPTSANIGRRDS